MEQRLLEVLEAFAQDGGVRALSVKGPAIAHLDTPDPAERTFADIDLLIHGADLDRAVAIIAGMGATRPWAERRPGYDHRFAKSVTLTMPDGIEIDVHRSLCDGAHGFRIDLDSIFLSATSFELGGVAVRCPHRTHRLLHAAYHLLLGSREPSLMNLRDLARALTDPTIDQDAVIDEVRAWRGDAVLAGAIDAVRETLGIVVPNWDEWRAGVSISERELAVIDRQRVEGSGLGRGKFDALRDLPRLADRVAYGYALVWPSRAHLESRGKTRRELWR